MMEVTTKGELAVQVHGAFEPFNGAMELAEFIADLGISGPLKHTCTCPLARLLTAMMDDRVVMVSPKDAAVIDDAGHTVEVLLPWVAQSFVARFDEGEFPYLVERDPDDDEPSDDDV